MSVALNGSIVSYADSAVDTEDVASRNDPGAILGEAHAILYQSIAGNVQRAVNVEVTAGVAAHTAADHSIIGHVEGSAGVDIDTAAVLCLLVSTAGDLGVAVHVEG